MSVCSSFVGHEGLHFLADRKHGSVNACVQILCGHMFSLLLGTYQGLESPGELQAAFRAAAAAFLPAVHEDPRFPTSSAAVCDWLVVAIPVSAKGVSCVIFAPVAMSLVAEDVPTLRNPTCPPPLLLLAPLLSSLRRQAWPDTTEVRSGFLPGMLQSHCARDLCSTSS